MIINKTTKNRIGTAFSANIKRSILTNKEQQQLIQNYRNRLSGTKKYSLMCGLKRFIDITHGIAGFIIAAPIMLLSAAAIRAESKGAVLFKQERLGKNGEPFTIYKLRKMYKEDIDNDFDIVDGEDEHITKVGKFLRKYSIDEFPQFWNIVKGEMSLIGPRPISERTHNIRKNQFKDYLARYAVKPGASLNYKNTKCTNDIDTINVERDYAKNWNLKIDFKTFLGMFSTVFGGKNY